ncbi:MAG: phosphoribosylglycinamide formyltransferase [Alphaproteobacteria bacterium]
MSLPNQMSKKSILVLISGRGSNLENLIKACNRPDYPAKIIGVISDQPDATGLNHAITANIPHFIITKQDTQNRAEYDQRLHNQFQTLAPDLILLAGFMRVLGAPLTTAWQGKIINIHPSLLPKYKGLNTHQRVLDAGDKTHGCTVHYVNDQLDGGQIIDQMAFDIDPNDNANDLARKCLGLEHQLYPKILNHLCTVSTKHNTQENKEFEPI